MATRKKKTEVIESSEIAESMEMPGTIGGAKIILPKNIPSGGWPKIVQGTHLTVKTFEDGHTELIWDDEQLLKEVREALASVEFNDLKPAVKAKAVTRKKKNV